MQHRRPCLMAKDPRVCSGSFPSYSLCLPSPAWLIWHTPVLQANLWQILPPTCR